MSWWRWNAKPKPVDAEFNRYDEIIGKAKREYLEFRETAKPGSIWEIPQGLTIHDIQTLDAEMLAEEKLHPSCMWDRARAMGSGSMNTPRWKTAALRPISG